MNSQMEKVSGDPRFPLLSNEVAQLIEQAVQDLGLGLDVAVCIVCQVAADYARSEYGQDYLPKLATLIVERGKMPMPNIAEGGRS